MPPPSTGEEMPPDTSLHKSFVSFVMTARNSSKSAGGGGGGGGVEGEAAVHKHTIGSRRRHVVWRERQQCINILIDSRRRGG